MRLLPRDPGGPVALLRVCKCFADVDGLDSTVVVWIQVSIDESCKRGLHAQLRKLASLRDELLALISQHCRRAVGQAVESHHVRDQFRPPREDDGAQEHLEKHEEVERVHLPGDMELEDDSATMAVDDVKLGGCASWKHRSDPHGVLPADFHIDGDDARQAHFGVHAAVADDGASRVRIQIRVRDVDTQARSRRSAVGEDAARARPCRWVGRVKADAGCSKPLAEGELERHARIKAKPRAVREDQLAPEAFLARQRSHR